LRPALRILDLVSMASDALLRLIGSFLVPGLVGCTAHSLADEQAEPPHPPVASTLAPAGKTVLFVGQDVASVEAYATSVAEPRGIVSYTSIQGLEGLDSAADTGGGEMHLSKLHDEFPAAPIALGLYLVGALEGMNAGDYDAQLDALATTLAGYSVPVLLRVGYEFDGPWNHYDPEQYRKAFLRVREHVVGGAENVQLVWQAAVSCGGAFGGHSLLDWYPGDDAVDFVAASYFAQSACQFSPVKQLVRLARDHQKPFMIAEAAPQGYDLTAGTYSLDGHARAPKSAAAIDSEWYAPYFAFIADNLDVVRASTYIDADWDSQAMWGAPYQNGYFGDSRVQANDALLRRWQAYLAAEQFQ
jgi:hypothetical protein